jgi:nucleotidyltransferase substrate binding protein (TIGR01987 family)
MERLKERIAQARRAVATFREAVGKTPPSVLERDAAILRFQYSFEAVWKAAQRYLGIVEQIETGSANGTIRSCRDIGLLADENAETALAMLRDRNLLVHMYQEKLAAALYPKLASYATALESWLERIEARLAGAKR